MYEERILLASASPRRRELIHQIDPEARFLSGDVDEYLPEGISPEKAVVMLAEKKALCSASLLKSAERKGTIVIGCDTIVALDGVIYGKPEDEADAARMLAKLSGRTHQVYTGVCLLSADNQRRSFVERTDVTFRKLEPEEIISYVQTGEPLDKAGAYGIQGAGWSLVDSFDGDYQNVVGLPVDRLQRELYAFEAERRPKRRPCRQNPVQPGRRTTPVPL